MSILQKKVSQTFIPETLKPLVVFLTLSMKAAGDEHLDFRHIHPYLHWEVATLTSYGGQFAPSRLFSHFTLCMLTQWHIELIVFLLCPQVKAFFPGELGPLIHLL
jgi:hypothetical protein